MAQQQLLLIILGTIIIGVSIYLGVLLFASSNNDTNREQIIADLQEMGTEAYSFIYRPVMMGGGGGSYATYTLSPIGPWGPENNNATYTISTQTTTQIGFTGTSKEVPDATVTITFDNFGKVVSGPVSSGF